MVSSTRLLLQVLACFLSLHQGSAIPHGGDGLLGKDNVLTKRVNPPVEMTRIDSGPSGRTYYGWVNHDVATMTEEQIAEYAKAGYDKISANFDGVVLVTALFIPHLGLSIASKPRSKDAAHAISTLGVEQCEAWFDQVKDRSTTEPTTQENLVEKILHSEDHAVVKGGIKLAEKKGWKSLNPTRWNMRSGKQFDAGTHAVTWGRYTAADTRATLKPACGDGVDSKLDPHCKSVLRALNIGSS